MQRPIMSDGILLETRDLRQRHCVGCACNDRLLDNGCLWVPVIHFGPEELVHSWYKKTEAPPRWGANGNLCLGGGCRPQRRGPKPPGYRVACRVESRNCR